MSLLNVLLKRKHDIDMHNRSNRKSDYFFNVDLGDSALFQKQNVRVLVVKDVAARGIHIPHLDNIMNFNFPAKSKLFVHRVGRCARAGCTGTAYSIVSGDEYPYLLIYIHFLVHN
ncbi:hypothetical protein PV328_006117 [Microctonus aethiopoides]|uniref:Helicase C-terminal domain-containing protein n=1 Tax=Microctonus aethiopoides TaxID=144406 RepID=A0AA39FNY3_9HYME|nr:hypothetical protein PV328_006117 [Microctonus aethiopoides]